MSDKLKELTPIPVTFVSGESPTSEKLENSFAKLERAADTI